MTESLSERKLEILSKGSLHEPDDALLAAWPVAERNTPSPVVETRSRTLTGGILVAASLSPLLGFFTLMVTHHLSRLTRELDRWVHAFGHWIPGSTGTGPDGSIGSYSGKETLALIVWGGSWLALHWLWRSRDFSIDRWISVFVGGLVLISLGFFHPLIDPVVLLLADVTGLR